MPLIEIGRWAIAVAFAAALVWASVSDLRTRTIPNRTVLVILALFLPWAAVNLGPWAVQALIAGALALAFGVGLYALGMVGAGDAKLFAAVALFAGLGHLLAFALCTALAGGVMAIVSLAARPQRALVMLTLRGKGDFGPGVPYGIAISLAGVLVVGAALLRVAIPFESV